MDNLHPQVHPLGGRPKDLDPRVTLLPVDVTSESGWDAVLKLVEPDILVHLAAETGTGQSLKAATRPRPGERHRNDADAGRSQPP